MKAILLSVMVLFPVGVWAQTLGNASKAVGTGSDESGDSSSGVNFSPSESPSKSENFSSNESPSPSEDFSSNERPSKGESENSSSPWRTDEVPKWISAQASRRSGTLSLTVEGSWTLPNVSRLSASGRWLMAGAELELHYNAFGERREDRVDLVGLGRLRLGLVLLESDHARFRILGGGLHWLDAFGHRLGFEVGAGLRLFPLNPWLLEFELTGGSMGDAGLLSARALVGYHYDGSSLQFAWKREPGERLWRSAYAGLPMELQLGWTHIDLKSSRTGMNAVLTGPTLGVRIWR